MWNPCRYIAFILRAGEPDQARLVDLGEAEPIDQMIAGFRRWIAGGLGGGDDSARGEWPADAAGPATSTRYSLPAGSLETSHAWLEDGHSLACGMARTLGAWCP